MASHRVSVRATRRATWCLVSVLLVGGCLRMVERYPPTWRSLRAEGCNAIVGTYENLGEDSKGKVRPLRVASNRGGGAGASERPPHESRL